MALGGNLAARTASAIGIFQLFLSQGLPLLRVKSRAVGARAPSIDVDSNGLNLAFVICAVSLFIATCRVFKISKITKRRQWIFYVAAILIVLTFDIGFEGGIIENYMNMHGYDRCAAQDRHVGHGKGSIWFNNYVLAGTPCSS